VSNVPTSPKSPFLNPRLQRLIFNHLAASGAAFAARTRVEAEDGRRLHVAVKFMPLNVAKRLTQGMIHHNKFGLVLNEALALALLRDHPGVPALHAVYAHGCTLIIVMELVGAWPDKDDLDGLKTLSFTSFPNKADLVRLQSCGGMELSRPHRYIRDFKRPGEIDVCKMSTIHLSTLQLMKDRGCSHGDIAHRNVVIDENYDVYSCFPGLPSTRGNLSILRD
jgi:serine/threonine protein kinase